MFEQNEFEECLSKMSLKNPLHWKTTCNSVGSATIDPIVASAHTNRTIRNEANQWIGEKMELKLFIRMNLT